jgi:hypothetical protein
MLWIILWIRGVEIVDNSVDNFVDKRELWISGVFIHILSTRNRYLSTILSTGRRASFWPK